MLRISSSLSICLLLAACGDNLSNPNLDAGVDGAPDAPLDASSYVPPVPFAIPLSATGADQLMSATAGPGGTFYAAGFTAADLQPGTPRLVVVVKLTAAGALDTTFGGGDGIATTTVAFTGGADEIDVATQADGKILVSSTVAAATINPVDADDTDLAVQRLDATGALDPTFGVAGLRVISLNESFLDASGASPVVRGRDGVRSLAVGADGAIYLHAYQRGVGNVTGGLTPRIDTEFVIAKLTAAGALDTSYGGGDGTHVLDIYAGGRHSNATPRGLHVLPDGAVIASGYANTAAVGDTTQAVLYKVTPAGTALDTTFADQGLFHEVVLATQTEIYAFAVHAGTLVTAGYGRNAGSINDWVSMKFDVATGARDATFGGAASGAVLVDPSGTMLGSNCHNALALPGGRTVLLGSTGPATLPTRDAAIAVLRADGTLDPAFGAGVHTFQLGANGHEVFWGGAVSGGMALIVGYKGGGLTPSPTVNDDAFGILLPAP